MTEKPMPQNLEKLKPLLAKLFQLDQVDLDFGIYPIMNARRKEIEHFINDDLLPQVRAVLSAYECESRSALQAELEKAKKQAKALDFEDPSQTPRVKKLQERYNAAFDLETAENEVSSHLCNFFRRYYSDGDFISLRRYKEGFSRSLAADLHWSGGLKRQSKQSPSSNVHSPKRCHSFSLSLERHRTGAPC